MVLDFLAVDNFDFTRKIVKKIWSEKLVKIEFLDKSWTFRIVCYSVEIRDFNTGVLTHGSHLLSFQPRNGLSFKAGTSKLCMQPLLTRALVLGRLRPASAASEAVS